MGSQRSVYDDPTVDNQVGDLVNTPDTNPVLEHLTPATGHPVPPIRPHQLRVLADFTLARDPEAPACIKVGPLALTAADAHRLALDLTEAADAVGVIRQKAGFEQ